MYKYTVLSLQLINNHDNHKIHEFSVFQLQSIYVRTQIQLNHLDNESINVLTGA